MNITFLIGNGFDLNLGMKTRYTDMYDSYIKSKSKSVVIQNFKKDLQKEEHNHYANWSDFEMGMAEYARKFLDEDDFIDCIRDFKSHMVGHLKSEEKSYEFNPQYAVKILWESIKSFYSGSTPNVTYTLQDIIVKNNYCGCSFITFNYTHILDSVISFSPKINSINSTNFELKQVIHIHGDLNNDVVLGVDNIMQVKNLFSATRKTDLAFIKPKFNNAYDSRRVIQATDAINNSSIICAFGLSLGESDKTWTNALKEWLLSDDKKHLIFYMYVEEEIPPYNYDIKIEKEYELKNTLFEKMQLTKKEIEFVEDRIHIPINNNIFNFTENSPRGDLVTV